jgi:hypothetical protein
VETDSVGALEHTGRIAAVELKQHRDTVDKNKPFVPLDAAEHAYTAQGGLTGEAPNYRMAFEADGYFVERWPEVLEVRCGPSREWCVCQQIYRFHRGTYLIDVASR